VRPQDSGVGGGRRRRDGSRGEIMGAVAWGPVGYEWGGVIREGEWRDSLGGNVMGGEKE